MYGLIEQCQLQLPWKRCSKRSIFLIKFSMKNWISEGVFSHFYLLLGPKLLGRLSHGGLQLWFGLHHPDVLGTPSLNGVGSTPVFIHQCQAKPPPVARDGILPGLWAGVLVPCRPRQLSGVHLTSLPELVEFGALSLLSHPFPSPFFFPFPFSFSLLFPSLPGFMLISCRRESATATGLFNRLLLLTKE